MDPIDVELLHDRRSEQRLRAVVTLELGQGATGVTRDISPSGMFFRTQASLREGDPVRFLVLFEDPHNGRKWRLAGHGWIVRVEWDAAGAGVGMRIAGSRFDRCDAGEEHRAARRKQATWEARVADRPEGPSTMNGAPPQRSIAAARRSRARIGD